MFVTAKLGCFFVSNKSCNRFDRTVFNLTLIRPSYFTNVDGQAGSDGPITGKHEVFVIV